MGLPVLLAALAILPVAQDPDGTYRLKRHAPSAEPAHADPAWLAKASASLLKGQEGRAYLLKEARSADPQRSQAARLTMLGSGDLRFLPILLDAIDSKRPLDAAVGAKAVDLYAEASWPILQSLARRGKPAAFAAIWNYAALGEPELRTLAGSKSSKVRAEAIRWVEDPAMIKAAVDDPSEAVQRNAVERLIGISQVIIEPLFTHPRASVRAFFAELYPAWTQKDFPRWVRLAQDPSPRVRQWAVIQLAPLGLGWGAGSWADAGIKAVGKAIQGGPSEVRSNAVLAARSWMLEWNQVRDWWTPNQVRRAQAIFRLPAFRDVIYQQARTESQRGRPDTERFGIQMSPAYVGLALSGDPRTLEVFRQGVGQRPWHHIDRIKALANVPGPQTIAYLFDLIDLAVARPSSGTQDFEADQVMGHAATVLEALGAKDYSRVRAHLDDRKTSDAHRVGLARSFAHVDSLAFFRSIERMIRDESVDEIARELATDGLANSPRSEAKAFLEEWVNQAPTERLRLSAQTALQNLRAKAR